MPALRTEPNSFDRLFTGIAVERPASLVAGDITGCEDIGPADTFDGGYGRLLERAYEKRAGYGVPNGFPLVANRGVGAVRSVGGGVRRGPNSNPTADRSGGRERSMRSLRFGHPRVKT